MTANMNIGILITSISNFGQKGYYNSQEVGLAKALSPLCGEVTIYKLVPLGEEKRTEGIVGYENLEIRYLPAKNFGINGKLDIRDLDGNLDALIHFSDTQFSVPKAYAWCRKNGIKYLPYIGVLESHSTSKLKETITNVMFSRNLRVYKACTCLVKTPKVAEELAKKGVVQTTVTPVGLDLSLLKQDFESVSKEALKQKYGFSAEDKVILFIGRMTQEKRPLEMLELFSKVYQKDHRYRLLMVGSGELAEDVTKRIQGMEENRSVTYKKSIPNSEIWETYRLADAFVNLNRQEIFGMAILEAMYYGCKVVAYHAPGPDFIIEDGKSGFLAEDERELFEAVTEKPPVSSGAHSRILEHFTWGNMANSVKETVEG